MTVRSATVDLLAADGTTTLKAGLRVSDGTYSEELNDAGAFSVTIPAQGTGSGYSDIDVDTLVRFKVDGSADYTGRVEQVDRTVDAADNAKTQSVIKGRDWLAEWADATVSPPLGVGVLPHTTLVRFDWTHPSLDTSAWTTPVYLGSLFTADLDPLGGAASPPPTAKSGWAPEGWPDTFTGWIAGAAVDGSGSHAVDAVGYYHLTLPCTAGILVPIFTADDFGQLAIDGAVIDAGQLPPSVQWTQAYGSGLRTVSAGNHTVRVMASNRTVEGNTLNVGNPTCFAAVFYQAITDAARESMVFDNVLARTGANTGPTDALTDGGKWRALWSPSSPPGFTAPAAIQTQLTLAQSDGCLTGWSITTHGTFATRDDITARVNDTLLDWLRQLAAQGVCDFAASASSRVLHLWPSGERGDFHTTPGSPPSWGDSQLSQVDVARRR